MTQTDESDASESGAQLYRFVREDEQHLIDVRVTWQRAEEVLELEVEAVYLDGSADELVGNRVAAMSAQYEYPHGGNRGSVNFGDRTHDRVDIATGSLRGMGLGSAMFGTLVAMLQELEPVPVAPFYLSENDASEENRERRNRFYERFGISFKYFDAEQAGARSLEMSSHDLVAREPSNHNGWVIAAVESA